LTKLLEDFRTFLFKGNIVDLAVAVVIGTAFAALVKALVADLLTPIIALVFGKPNFGTLSFTLNSSHFLYGDFINATITFVSVGAAIFFLVVKPMEELQKRRKRDPTTKECPACTSEIPIKARRCPQCTLAQQIYSVAAGSAAADSTEITRPLRPRLNCTVPADLAKIVSSLPMPTPSPGLKTVPRWRTMISPPVTVWPANTFTPRRLAFESRPLREEPSPFL
jgi:large conductance mechanosensitive channel